jgi:hypothetical protein
MGGRTCARRGRAGTAEGAESAGGRHVLVVANRTTATSRLLGEIERRAKGTTCRFALLIPDVSDPKAADWTLDSALPLLERAAKGPVEGFVGGPDPFQSIQQAVREHDFHEIIISTLPKRLSKWLGNDLPRRAERLGLPVTVVTPVKERLRDLPGARARSDSPSVPSRVLPGERSLGRRTAPLRLR